VTDFGMSFHHMGLAVRQEKHAIIFLKGANYQIGEKIYDPLQNVNLRLCTAVDKPAVELIMPGIGDGPLTAILASRAALFYHNCYEVIDRNKTLLAMDAAGLRVIPVADVQPAILFDDREVSFYTVMGFGVIELLVC
jgi:methylmalonyl-CoA/ethylmalonyl-CoA epimerase